MSEEAKVKDPKIVNSVTLVEIRIHKLDNGKERTEVICQEVMATKFKNYTIGKILEAAQIINRAIKREALVKPVSEAMFSKLRRGVRGAFGRGNN